MPWTCSGCGYEINWCEEPIIADHLATCDKWKHQMNTSDDPLRTWNLQDFWQELSDWSQVTFGNDKVRGPVGPLKHLYKELKNELIPCDPDDLEFARSTGDPYDLEEYADVIFLAFDACRRTGFDYWSLVSAIKKKLEKNKARKWPVPSSDKPVEHIRDEEK